MDLSGRVLPPDSREIESCAAALRQAERADVPLVAWAAAMLAGRVEMDLRFDESAARARFERAAQSAAPGSIEAMVATWSVAESYKAESAAEAYRKTCERIVVTFTAFGDSRIYQKAQKNSGK